MSQRVVVLTDDQIRVTLRALEEEALAGPDADLLDCTYARFKTALEHPEGITDEMVERASWALIEAQGWVLVDQRRIEDYRDEVLTVLGAALFPGDELVGQVNG